METIKIPCQKCEKELGEVTYDYLPNEKELKEKLSGYYCAECYKTLEVNLSTEEKITIVNKALEEYWFLITNIQQQIDEIKIRLNNLENK